MTHLQCIRGFGGAGVCSSASDFQTCSKNEVYNTPLQVWLKMLFFFLQMMYQRSTVSLELWGKCFLD